MATIVDTPYGIASLRLATLARAARLKADHGISMARNLPSIKTISAEYALYPVPRTWKQCAAALASLEGEVKAGRAPYGELNGRGYFAPMAAVRAGIVELG